MVSSYAESDAKQVVQINKETKRIIRIWPSIRSVKIALGLNTSNISQCCIGTRKSVGGFIWKHQNLVVRYCGDVGENWNNAQGRGPC